MGNPRSNRDDQARLGRWRDWRLFEEFLISALLVVVFARIFHSQQEAQLGRRMVGRIPRKTQQERSWSTKFQLPSIITVAFGLGLCACSLAIRVADSKYPQVSEYAFEDQRLGVYLDLTSQIALLPMPEKSVLRSDLPEHAWTMKLEPGKKVRATFLNVLLDSPGLQKLNVTSEVRAVFTLPPGANMINDERPLRVNSGGTCASWYDGNLVHYAFPSVQRSGFGSLTVICTVPPIGHVDDLFFDIAFEWPDHTYIDSGYGRYVGGIRFEYIVSTPSDITLPPQRGPMGLPPLEFALAIPDGARLAESFPSPSGGRAGERRWKVGNGLDIEYSIERPSARVWVQPASDLTLLLGGVALGLTPAFWRRTDTES